jgi:thymidylate synthase (FAD)
VSEIGFDFVIPPAIAADAQASYIFDGAMGALDMEYRQLVKRLTEVHAAAGMSLGEAKKKAQEDARFVLPNACCTQLVFTMNARALLNFFAKRCCNRAQWEIRQMANEMLALCKGVAPNIFASAGAPCLRGVCPEGRMSCKAGVKHD